MKQFLSTLAVLIVICGIIDSEAFARVNEEWVATYNGPGNSFDEAKKVVTDSQGNVIVTGTSGGALSNWDDSANDILTIKYDQAGNVLWEARYNGPANNADAASAMVVDSSGSVYVTGTSFGNSNSWDYVTIKYDSDGIEQWVARYDGSNDFAASIAVDDSGNVYVTGSSTHRFGWSGYDLATVKYNSDGVQQWEALYNDRYGDDFATSIAVDKNGNVYVTGSIGGGGGSVWCSCSYWRDYGTFKYSPDGTLQWIARYTSQGEDVATSIVVDTNDNIYVTGYSASYYSAYDYHYDYATIKYASDGEQLWVTRYNGSGHGNDIPTSMVVDTSGNVYVTGYSAGSEKDGSVTNSDYATIKYSSNGEQQWVARYDGSEKETDVATAIALDAGGNAYVTGYSTGKGTDYDYATIKYSPLGVQQWLARYNGGENDNDAANSIALDDSGNVYVTGYSYGDGRQSNYVTVKYSQKEAPRK